MFSPWKKSYDQPRQCIIKQRHHFTNKSPYSQSYRFLVVMYGCESWTIKKVEYWGIDAFELWCWRRLLSVPWTARRPNQSILKEINPKFIGRIVAEAEASILWPLDVKSWLIGKDPDPGKDWRQEKGATDDEMVGWHHLLNGHEFEQIPGEGERQGCPMCCTPWGNKELDMTYRLNNNSRKSQRTKSKVKTSSKLSVGIKHLMSNCIRQIKDFLFTYSHMQNQGVDLV